MTVCQWISVVGYAIATAGVVLAIIGVGSLKNELFPGRPLPFGRAVASTWRWFRVRVLRQNIPARTGSATLEARVSASATVAAALQTERPTTYEPSAAWTRYLEEQIKNLQEVHSQLADQVSERMSRLERQVSGETQSLLTRIAELDALMRRSLGGADGSGLDLAWWGLVLTVIGSVLQALGTGMTCVQ